MLDGKLVVDRCPCNTLARYERLFWKNRNVIASYLENRAKTIQEIAEDESNLAKSVKGIC